MNAPPETVDPEKQPDAPSQPVGDLPPSGNDVEHLRLSEHEVDMLYYSYLRRKAIKSATPNPPIPVTADVTSSNSGR